MYFLSISKGGDYGKPLTTCWCTSGDWSQGDDSPTTGGTRGHVPKEKSLAGQRGPQPGGGGPNGDRGKTPSTAGSSATGQRSRQGIGPSDTGAKGKNDVCHSPVPSVAEANKGDPVKFVSQNLRRPASPQGVIATLFKVLRRTKNGPSEIRRDQSRRPPFWPEPQIQRCVGARKVARRRLVLTEKRSGP